MRFFFFLFYGRHFCIACTRSLAEMEVTLLILQSASTPKSAFVARCCCAESKHMRNMHVICSMNRRPSCMALTALNNVNKNNTRCLSAYICVISCFSQSHMVTAASLVSFRFCPAKYEMNPQLKCCISEHLLGGSV